MLALLTWCTCIYAYPCDDSIFCALCCRLVQLQVLCMTYTEETVNALKIIRYTWATLNSIIDMFTTNEEKSKPFKFKKRLNELFHPMVI